MKTTATKTAAIVLFLSVMGGCESVEEAKTFHTCAEGKRVIAAGVETTYVECKGSWQHRTQVTMCGSVLPRSESCFSGTGVDACATDMDCMDRSNGHCDAPFPGGCECQYGCTSDADCNPGEICLCGEPVGACVPATCKADADCGAGYLCSTYVSGCGGFQFACQTPEDQCQSEADCGSGQTCGLGEAGHRVCVPQCFTLR